MPEEQGSNGVAPMEVGEAIKRIMLILNNLTEEHLPENECKSLAENVVLDAMVSAKTAQK